MWEHMPSRTKKPLPYSPRTSSQMRVTCSPTELTSHQSRETEQGHAKRGDGAPPPQATCTSWPQPTTWPRHEWIARRAALRSMLLRPLLLSLILPPLPSSWAVTMTSRSTRWTTIAASPIVSFSFPKSGLFLALFSSKKI